ncbi:MAG: choice-of-anchor Q domain-containing protein [Pseudomonadota bacterium]
MATITVTTLLDENDANASVAAPGGTGLSLREAIAISNASAGADRIEFADGLSGLVRLNFDANPAPPYVNQLFITDETTIDGGGVITITGDALGNDNVAPGSITTLAYNGVNELQDNSRVFFIRENADTTLIGLTLTGGRARNDNGAGGAIFSQSDVTLIDSRLSGNSTSGDNAAGGAVFSSAAITIIDSEISDNSTSGERSYGGGVAAEGDLTITRSEVSQNVTVGSLGYGGGAFAGVYSSVVVTDSTLSGNRTTGFASSGGAIDVRSDLTMVNSTVADNHVYGERSYGGGLRTQGPSSITHSTITGNNVAEPSSIEFFYTGGGVLFREDLTIANSIITGNSSAGDGFEVSTRTSNDPGELIFNGFNIIGADASGFDASLYANVVNADPATLFAGGLADNGGPVRTIALSGDVANPALDAVGSAYSPEADARGRPRERDIDGVDNGGTVDIGAYELNVANLNGDGIVLQGQVGADELPGTENDDEIAGDPSGGSSGGADTLRGFRGDDTLKGGLGDDILDGGEGVDTADFSDATSDTLAILLNREGIAQSTLSSGRDVLIGIENLIGSNFDDRLFGDAGANRIEGGDGGDTIDGVAGGDSLFGGDGNDGFRARGGPDLFDGGDDFDFVNFTDSTGVNAFLDGSGTNGRAAVGDTFTDIENLIGSATGGDLLFGDEGANRLTGLGGDDLIRGRAGVDQLEGGAGDDTLIGDEGADVIVTGTGADTIFFNTAPNAAERDRITDFESGVDSLRIDTLVFGGGLVSKQAAVLVANGNPSATTGDATFLYDTDNGTLRFDADGTGAGASVLFALLQNVPTLDAGDFVFE